MIAVVLVCAGTAAAARESAQASAPAPALFTVASVTSNSISIAWPASARALRVVSYGLYRDGVLVGSRTDPQARFKGLGCGRRYLLQIDAVNAAGTRSPRVGSYAQTATCPDRTPPTIPRGLTVTGRAQTSIAVSWTASTDNVGVAGYRLYRNAILVGTTTSTRASFDGLICDRFYLLAVIAFDRAGNRSLPAVVIARTVSCPDTTRPTDPGGLAATGSTGDSITVAWTPSTDNVGVAGYDLFRDGASAGYSADTSATFGGLACATSYKLEVDAVDGAGNHSGRAAVVGSTPPCPDTTPPTAPDGLIVTGSTGDSITVAWTPSTDDVGVAGYDLFRDGTGVGSADGTSATFGGLACGKSYKLEVDAADAAGNHSARSGVTASTAACPADRFVAPDGADYRWSFIAATYDAASHSLDLYVDGTHVSSTAVSGALAPAVGRIFLGGDQPWGEWFSGLLDNVRIYSRALAPAELQTDMNTPVTAVLPAPNPLELVAAYAFDETSGVTLHDLSGNANDGTVDGASWTGGHSGGALAFDGTDDRVTIADSPSLDLTTGMTLEAWVRPNQLGDNPSTDWRAAIYKEQPGSSNLDYALYAHAVEPTHSSTSVRVFTDAEHETHAPAALAPNTCTTASSPCLTFDRAYHAAQPGQVVAASAGVYGDQRIEADPSKAAGPDVLFSPAPGATVTVGAVTIAGASHLELRDMTLAGWHTLRGTDSVTFRDITAGILFVDSSSNISVIGGSYGPQTNYDDGQIRPACPGCPHSTNILVDGVLFHDAILGPGSDAHVECLQVWGIDQLVIRNSKFFGCEQHGVFISGEAMPVSDITFENNEVAGLRTGFYSLRITASGPGEGCTNILYRNNSTTAPINVTCLTVDNVRIVGNLGPYSSEFCDSRYTYSHNVWDGAVCGPTDLNAPSGFANPAGLDLNLLGTSAAINAGDPADYPATDIYGHRRPRGLAPDAGAVEAR